MKTNVHPQAQALLPRKPSRSNGRARYDALLLAAERVLEREGAAGLTIKKVAEEASVPKASAYHFFPSPAAVSAALNETYATNFLNMLDEAIPDRDKLSWRGIARICVERAIGVYQSHPYAQTLVLGSDYLPEVRHVDLNANRQIASILARQFDDKFGDIPEPDLMDALALAISISDATLSVSVAQYGSITKFYAAEAVNAFCGYLAEKFEK